MFINYSFQPRLMVRKTLAGVLFAGAFALGGCQQNTLHYSSTINGKEITFEEWETSAELTVRTKDDEWYFKDLEKDGSVDLVRYSLRYTNIRGETYNYSPNINLSMRNSPLAESGLKKADEIYAGIIKLIERDINLNIHSSRPGDIPAEKP